MSESPVKLAWEPQIQPEHGALTALLLADARLPIGGHTRSGSLEPALAAGVDDIPGFINLHLRTVVRTDAGTAVVARRHALAGLPLEPVLDAWRARTPSAALRADAEIVGAALVRLASRRWQLVPLPANPPGALVLGAIAAATGIDAADIARVVAYDAVQTITSAALKLRPGDPLEVAGWTLAAFPAIASVVSASADIVTPDQIPARSAPHLESYAEAHTTTTRRLFRA